VGKGKVFSEIRFSSGETLGEAIIRLREEAASNGMRLLVLGWDGEGNKFAAGHVPATNDKLTELLFEFISWVGRGEAREEQASKPAPSDSRFS
jgi:hypothetical protein